jgi:hypothetical protein
MQTVRRTIPEIFKQNKEDIIWDFNFLFQTIDSIEKNRDIWDSFTTDEDLATLSSKLGLVYQIIGPTEFQDNEDKGFYLFFLEDGVAIANRKLLEARYGRYFGLKRFENFRKIDDINDEEREFLKAVKNKKSDELSALNKIV